MARPMPRLSLILAILLGVAAAAARAAPADDPLALIQSIYRSYQAGTDTPGHSGVYSRRLQGLVDADEKNTPKGEVGKIDWDVFVDGNDWALSKLRIVLESASANRARVRARFLNFKELRDMAFDLVREDGRWVIDEVASMRKGGRWTMSKVLTGAPDAFPDEKK
jgi:Protein of unknown function (DUF3828)